MRYLLVVCTMCLCSTLAMSNLGYAQLELLSKKQLTLSAQSAKDNVETYHLLPAEEEQELGNAVPVLLRMVYEQNSFMSGEYYKLDEYAKMDIGDPKLSELSFDYFARQAIRAGSMSHANWEYPLRAENPYSILLPDVQSQRQLIGQGMRAWGKQRLAKGDMTSALTGIKAQLGCARHCASTPIGICHFVGLAISNLAFENLELAMQYESCPNLYWSLASLSPTLGDLGPMVRWEIWASPARLTEPLPAVGDDRWTLLAKKFQDSFEIEISNSGYTAEETSNLQKNIDRLAQKDLAAELGFSESDIAKMSPDERSLRWFHFNYCRFRTQVEPLTYQSPPGLIETAKKIEAANKAVMASIGAKVMPYPVTLPHVILSCRNFERRVKMLQTIEAIRDHASRHGGALPTGLDQLRLPAPNDPFTGKPFEYSLRDGSARLFQTKIEGCATMVYDYELTVKK